MEYVCKYCGDAIDKWKCPDCGQITDQCKLCHNELAHDKIVPQFMKPQFGGTSDPFWWDDEDAQGYGANARKHMEDG